MRLRCMFVAALLTATAASQVTIPAHSSVYTGLSRGYQFVANTSFRIVELSLPPESFLSGYTASYLVRVNGNIALHSRGNVGAISTSIPIVSGDSVDVIGNWSPAAAGSFTARNSYGSNVAGSGAAPFATSIQGVPHTLNRTGWQWDIGDPAWSASGSTGSYAAPSSGQIGRVLMTTTPNGAGIYASNTPLGAGCGQSYNSFYETYSTSLAMDLSGTALVMTPAAGGYTVGASPASLVQPSATATTLALGDDAQASITLSSALQYPGGSTTTLVVCSNGFVSAATGNGTAFGPDVGAFLNAPQASWRCWHDFNPTSFGSGQVKFEEIAGIAYVTWDGVHSFGSTTPERLQFQFALATGAVTMVFGSPLGGAASSNGFLVGFSPGGSSLNPGATDLSSALAAGFSTAGLDVPPLTLAAASRPLLGTNWSMSVTNIPSNGTLGIQLYSLTDPQISDLASVGAPGCGLRANIGGASDFAFFYFATGNTQAFSLALPTDPVFANLELFVTTALLQDPPTNAIGGITANGIKGRLGSL